MLMFLKSSDCLDLFPNNTASRFFVKIPEIMNFKSNQTLSIIDLNIPGFVQEDIDSVYVSTNIVSEVIVGCKKIPVVQRFFVEKNNTINAIKFDGQNVQTKVREINTDVIEISIINGNTLQHVECNSGITYCGFQII